MDSALESIIQLIILFFVIFDPFVSLAVFVIATQKIDRVSRNQTATLAVGVAFVLSVLVLFFGQNVLSWLSTTLDDFRVAGGIILALLGIKMATGHSLVEPGRLDQGSARAIAAIIGTPLLTGPAAITTIIIATNDYGRLITGASVAIVLTITAIMFYQAERINKFLGSTAIQAISTMLGLITIAWGVKFIRVGLGI